MIKSLIGWLVSDDSLQISLVINFFRKSGLIHLLAVSGIHFCLISYFIYLIVRRLCPIFPRVFIKTDSNKPAAFVTIVCSFIFLHYLEYPISAKRAFSMSSYYLIAKAMYLPTSSIRIFLLTITIFYSLEDSLTGSLSFQLSFTATFALIIFFMNKKTEEIGKIKSFIKNNFLVSLICNLATAPIIIYNFKHFPTYSLLANIIAVPIFTFLFLPSLLIGGLIYPVQSENLFLVAAKELFLLITNIAKYFSSLPFSYPRIELSLLSIYSFTALFWSKLFLSKANIIICFLILFFLFSLLISKKIDYDLVIEKNGKNVTLYSGNNVYYLTPNNYNNLPEYLKSKTICNKKICKISELGNNQIGIVYTKIAIADYLELCNHSNLVIDLANMNIPCKQTQTINKTDLWFNGSYYLKFSPSLEIYNSNL